MEFSSHKKDWKKFELNNNGLLLSCCKKISALLRRITSKDDGDFYYLNFLHLGKLRKCENVCKNCDYCYAEMPKEDNKILKYNHREKFIKVPFIIYADMKSLLQKLSTCHNNLKKSWTTKINVHTAYSYSLFMHCSYDTIKNKLDYYRGWKNWMKNFCKDLKKHAAEIIKYEKKQYH